MSFIKRWNLLNRKDQLRWMFITTLLVIGVYGLVLYPITNKAVLYSENMVNRKLDRLKKRTVITTQSSYNVGALNSELKKLEKNVVSLETSISDLRTRFSPADRQQSSLLELSALAQKSGLRIFSQGRGTGTNSAGEVSGAMDELSGRPLLLVKAQGDYWQLLDFLQGLKLLEYVSSPLGISIVATGLDTEDEKEVDTLPPGALQIHLTLTL